MTNKTETAAPAVVFGARQTRSFHTRQEAWEFMRAVDAAGGMAGYPELGAPWSVEFLLPVGK